MRNTFTYAARLNLVPWLIALNGVLVLAYIGLIAVVMSYATLQVEFAQSVRSDESVVAALEASYLAEVAHITETDYAGAGYERPLHLVFVPGAQTTALSAR